MESEFVPVLIGDIGGTNWCLKNIKINIKDESINILKIFILKCTNHFNIKII